MVSLLREELNKKTTMALTMKEKQEVKPMRGKVSAPCTGEETISA